MSLTTTVAPAARRPTLSLVERALGNSDDAVSEAARRGVIEVGDEIITFVHPLYGSAVYAMAGATRRRRVHRLLAGVVDDAGEVDLSVGGDLRERREDGRRADDG